MRSFLRLLHRNAAPRGVLKQFRLTVGDAQIHALQNEGILLPGTLADRYPCPGRGTGCPMRIVENADDTHFGLMAVPASTRCCHAIPLTFEEATEWYVDHLRLAARIAELHGVRGAPDVNAHEHPLTTALGRVPWRGVECDALLCLDLTRTGAAGFLFARTNKGRRTVVFTHARMDSNYPNLDQHFGPGDTVEIVYLEDCLSVAGDNLALLSALPQPLAGEGNAPAFCLLVTERGREIIDRATYDQVVANRRMLQLFLNRIAGAGAECAAGRQLPDGTFESVNLSAQHALIVSELIEKSRPLRVDQLDALRTTGADRRRKQVEAARKAIDVPLGTRKWRAIQLHRRSPSEANEYSFDPPDGMRFAALLPI